MREASLPPKLVRNAVLTASGRLLGELIGHFVARNARVCRDHMTVTSFCPDTRCVHTSMAALAQFWPGPSPSGRMRWMAACESEKTVYQSPFECVPADFGLPPLRAGSWYLPVW